MSEAAVSCCSLSICNNYVSQVQQARPFSIHALLEEKKETKAEGPALVYTLDALEGSDGRLRAGRAAKEERFSCEHCGKNYATSSNLSRHKQTHRPLSSPHARQCPHCERVYVSMPALR